MDGKTLEKIKGILIRFSEVQEVTSLRARNAGRYIFVTIELRLFMKRLGEAHHLADNLERAIRQEIPFVERVVIQYEPGKRESVRYAVPLNNREGDIFGHFGGSPFIGMWDKRKNDGTVLLPQVLENPFTGTGNGKGIKLAEFLVEKGVDVLYLKKSFEGKGPEYVFSNEEIDVRVTNEEKRNDLMNCGEGRV